jgi:hemolysin III
MTDRVLSRAEFAADGIVHLLGVCASVLAFTLLIALYLPLGHMNLTVAVSIYALTAVGLFCTSAAYHLVPNEYWKPILQRLDHAAIHFKIAGTYTPLVVLMGGWYAFAILGIVWIGAALGASLRLVCGDRFDRFAIGIYLLLGWTSVALVGLMFQKLPKEAAYLVIIGGLLYTIGIIFHVRKNMRFQKAIWHGFVLCASACHFTAIAWSAGQIMA